MTPEALLAGLRAGDPAAIETLYDRHAADVLRWVIRLGGPHLDAEDVAHEVFEKAIRAAPRLRGTSSPRTWLFGVTRGTVANARRRAAFRRFIGLDSVPEPRGTADTADEVLEQADRRRLVQQALEALTTRQREVVVLVDLEEVAATEAAAMLGLPVGTVYSRLHAGRRGLQRALEAAGWAGSARADNVVPLRRPR